MNSSKNAINHYNQNINHIQNKNYIHNGNIQFSNKDSDRFPNDHSNLSRVSQTESQYKSVSESATSSINSLSTYYNSKLTNLKLIYLIFTFVNILLGIFVLIEHKSILYKEFKFLYFYVILSITYWPGSILFAGVLIILLFIKQKLFNSKDLEDKENSLMIQFDTISLTNYNMNNNHYSYLIGFFLFTLLGFYILSIPSSVYIIYHLFKLKTFYMHMYNFFNIYLFVIMNVSKSIAIGISSLFIFHQKYKTNRIKIELDDEFVKKIEEEIEQVKRCSGIFIADINTIKKNDMFNRQMLSLNIANGKDNSRDGLGKENFKNNFNFTVRKNSIQNIVKEMDSHKYKYEYAKNSNNNFINSDCHNDFMNKKDSSSVINLNNNNTSSNHNYISNKNNSQIDISPDKYNYILPKNLDTSYIGNYNNFNHSLNKNFEINDIVNTINNKEILMKDKENVNNKAASFGRPMRMSDKKTQIKEYIKTKTMDTRNKENFINDLKKQLKLDSNNDIIQGNSNRNSLNDNNISPIIVRKVSNKFYQFQAMINDDECNVVNRDDLISSSESDESKSKENLVNSFCKKISLLGSKAKDDMDINYSNNINRNDIIISVFHSEDNIKPIFENKEIKDGMETHRKTLY